VKYRITAGIGYKRYSPERTVSMIVEADSPPDHDTAVRMIAAEFDALVRQTTVVIEQVD
jgi:hypothetical protein